MTDRDKIEAAWQEEASISRLGMRPAPDKSVQRELVPEGGDWSCVVHPGASTLSVVWDGKTVAHVNPSGWMFASLEGEIAMGIRAMPVADKALRAIFILAIHPENLDLIGRIARAAVAYIEAPAPQRPQLDDESETDE